MSPQSERDPRVDPQPGDILRGVGEDGVARYVAVHWVNPEWVGYLKAEDFGKYGSLLRTKLQTFREDASEAEVVQRGDA